MIGTYHSRARTTAVLAALIFAVGMLSLARPSEAAFPGTNGKISFTSTRDGDNEIYTMNADGTDQVRLTNNAAQDTDSAYSPDGTRIAFASTRDGNSEIYVMDAVDRNGDGNGDDLRRVTNSATTESQPVFSPDGTKLAFTGRQASNELEVFVANVDGTGTPTNLTNNATSDDSSPAYSPSGNKIAFTSNRDANEEIYVMDADPSTSDTPTNLTNSSVADDADPAYSPNGQRIAFTSADQTAGSHFLAVMDTDPSTNDALALHADGTVDREPAFSPDGTRITFVSFESGQQQVFVAGATSAGPPPVNISNNTSLAEVDPDWGILPVDLSIVQTDSRDPAKVGSNLTYTLTVTNTGTNATGVAITDGLPSGASFVSATSGCTHSEGTVTCNLGNVTRGSTRISQITVNPTVTGTLTNAVSVSSNSSELNTDDNSDRERTQVFNNRAPVANSDGYVIDEDTTLATFSLNGVLRDDTDADGDTLTATKVTDPENGTLTFNSNGSFTYEPNDNFNGVDEFTYKANDGTADSSVASVVIRIRSVDDAPIANFDQVNVEKDTPTNIDVLANDSDGDGDEFSITEVTSPNHGTATETEDGRIRYSPDAGYTSPDFDPDFFSYTITDSNGDTGQGFVSVTVRDTTAPTVLRTKPASGAVNVAPSANVEAFFSEAINVDTLVNGETVKLVKKGTTTHLAATVSYDPLNKKMILDPNKPLTRRATYIATITTGVKDRADIPLAANKVWNFKIKS